MTPQIRLQKQQLADLQMIGGIGKDTLCRVVAEVGRLPLAPVHPRTLQEAMARALEGDDMKADAVLRQALSLHGMLRQLDLTTEEVFAGLMSGLRPLESGWSEEEFKRWESATDAFREVFELPIVRLSAKALDLSYEHSHLLQRVRIITDVRPIYNQDATRIEASVISHKLVIRYDDVEGEHALSLSADERDLKGMIKQCERALRKAETAKTHLEEKAGVKTLLPGKEQDE